MDSAEGVPVNGCAVGVLLGLAMWVVIILLLLWIF